MRALTLLAAASLLAAFPATVAESVRGPEGLLAAIGADDSDRFAYAVHLGKEGTRHQARVLEVDLDAVRLDVPRFDRPSDGLFVLAARHGVDPTPEQRAQILALDALEGAIPAALAQTVNAFLVYEAVTLAAFEGVTLEDFEAVTSGPNPFAAVGVDVAPILASRLLLLDAAIALRNALPDETEPPAVTGCGGVSVPPAFTIDVSTCSLTYFSHVALQIDAGGSDSYQNNAGGSNSAGCAGAGALFDLGQNGDTYGASWKGCGQNGGGQLGSGFLLEEGGHSVYWSWADGTNGGGGTGGLGFLLDASGDDDYYSGSGSNGGTNGGGDIGVGYLLDVGGNDAYLGAGNGVNGGGWTGTGLLVDVGGSDYYEAGSTATNGGGALSGVGTLLDTSGSDVYYAGSGGTNGGGNFGTGLLLDLAGSDYYSDWEFGAGGDRTIAPKGIAGAQLDVSVSSIPVVPVGAVPTGAPVVGPDADADGLPRYVDFPQSHVTLGGPSLLTLGSASPLRVNVDPNDFDRCNPACVPTTTTPPFPSGAPTLGPDADRDGVPAYVDIPQSTATLHSEGPALRTSSAPAMRVTIDSNDANPCVPACVPGIGIPSGATLGPDADRDGLPAYVDVRQIIVTVRGDGTVTTTPGSSARFHVDSADNDPNVRTPAASVPLPFERVDVGQGNARLVCAGVEQLDTPGVTLVGTVQTSVPGRSVTEPNVTNALRCTALALVPRSV